MKELIEKYEHLKNEQDRILDEKENIRNKFIKFAKFKQGDTVTWQVQNWDGQKTGENIQGIVRTIFTTKSRYDDNLSIHYIIGKIKKNGEIHGNQNIHYSAIPESELLLI